MAISIADALFRGQNQGSQIRQGRQREQANQFKLGNQQRIQELTSTALGQQRQAQPPLQGPQQALGQPVLDVAQQPIDTAEQDQALIELFQRDPNVAIQIKEELGLRSEQQKIEGSEFAFRAGREKDPARRNEMIQQRAQTLQSQGRDARETVSLLDRPHDEQSKLLRTVELALMSPEDRQKALRGGKQQAPGAGQFTLGNQRFGPEGNLIATGQVDSGDEADRSLRERQIAVSESSLADRQSKLSAGLEKALLTSQDRTVEAQRSANEFDVLAGDFDRRAKDLEGGVVGSFTEFLKATLGTQDDVTEFRRRFNKVRLSEGLKSLPPGPATDRDVQEAFKGVPRDNASPEQVASFLRGAARLARFDAGYNQFKSDFISRTSSAKGLNNAWRKQAQSPILKRKVSLAEVYETAQNRNITPEEVIEKLGLSDAGLI